MITSTTAGEDTEITLGTGKMLVLFFGLVALCAVFFGMGYKLGKNSSPGPVTDGSVVAASSGDARSSSVKPAPDANANRSPDLAFYKSTEPAKTSAPAAAATPAGPDSNNAGAAGDKAVVADPTVAPPTSGYYVQVAAVSKSEDGDALVDALKKKQYAAFSSAGADKLFHVEVGPFADIKIAEDTRAKLIGDGYNPILKK